MADRKNNQESDRLFINTAQLPTLSQVPNLKALFDEKNTYLAKVEKALTHNLEADRAGDKRSMGGHIKQGGSKRDTKTDHAPDRERSKVLTVQEAKDAILARTRDGLLDDDEAVHDAILYFREVLDRTLENNSNTIDKLNHALLSKESEIMGLNSEIENLERRENHIRTQRQIDIKQGLDERSTNREYHNQLDPVLNQESYRKKQRDTGTENVVSLVDEAIRDVDTSLNNVLSAVEAANSVIVPRTQGKGHLPAGGNHATGGDGPLQRAMKDLNRADRTMAKASTPRVEAKRPAAVALTGAKQIPPRPVDPPAGSQLSHLSTDGPPRADKSQLRNTPPAAPAPLSPVTPAPQ